LRHIMNKINHRTYSNKTFVRGAYTFSGIHAGRSLHCNYQYSILSLYITQPTKNITQNMMNKPDLIIFNRHQEPSETSCFHPPTQSCFIIAVCSIAHPIDNSHPHTVLQIPYYLSTLNENIV